MPGLSALAIPSTHCARSGPFAELEHGCSANALTLCRLRYGQKGAKLGVGKNLAFAVGVAPRDAPASNLLTHDSTRQLNFESAAPLPERMVSKNWSLNTIRIRLRQNCCRCDSLRRGWAIAGFETGRRAIIFVSSWTTYGMYSRLTVA
jgi:hypothetical protein